MPLADVRLRMRCLASQSHRRGIVASTQNGPVTRVILLSALGAVHQHLLVRRLVVGDGLERDVRDDSAHLFALVVLLALVDEPARRATRFVIQFVPGKRRCEQSLSRQRQRNAAGVDRDPAPSPLFRDSMLLCRCRTWDQARDRRDRWS